VVVPVVMSAFQLVAAEPVVAEPVVAKPVVAKPVVYSLLQDRRHQSR
jgi:hypothetical protein